MISVVDSILEKRRAEIADVKSTATKINNRLKIDIIQVLTAIFLFRIPRYSDSRSFLVKKYLNIRASTCEFE